jgi:hypothetical protein
LPRADRIVGSWSQVRTKCEDFFARQSVPRAIERGGAIA